jgi:hypothetical protein
MFWLGAVDVVATTLPIPPLGALVAALLAVVAVVFLVVAVVDLAVVAVDRAVVDDVTPAVVVGSPGLSTEVEVVASAIVDVVDSDVAVVLLPPPPQAASTRPTDVASASTLHVRTDPRRG